MRNCPNGRHYLQRRCCTALLTTVTLTVIPASYSTGQTASTGALTGVTLGPAGAVVPDAVLHLVNVETGETQSATSDGEGRLIFALLPPGSFDLQPYPGFDRECLLGRRNLAPG
jgi:hypothetical protein